jgi:hypothetical protein
MPIPNEGLVQAPIFVLLELLSRRHRRYNGRSHTYLDLEFEEWRNVYWLNRNQRKSRSCGKKGHRQRQAKDCLPDSDDLGDYEG